MLFGVLLAKENVFFFAVPLYDHLTNISSAMLFSRSVRSVLLRAMLSRALLAAAVPAWSGLSSDPCANIAGLQFVDPADAIACQKSFPFNETLRKNVLAVVSRVFDFYTFEDFYLNAPRPFHESTSNIRSQIWRISRTRYDVSTFSTLPEMKPLMPRHRLRATIVSTWPCGTSRIS